MATFGYEVLTQAERTDHEIQTGLWLNAQRIERRRAYWTIQAIQSSLSFPLDYEWYEATLDDPAEAKMRHQMDSMNARAQHPISRAEG